MQRDSGAAAEALLYHEAHGSRGLIFRNDHLSAKHPTRPVWDTSCVSHAIYSTTGEPPPQHAAAMVDAATKSTVSKLPMLSSKASPRDGEGELA